MGLKPDHWIRKMAHEHKMIEPFIENQVRDQVISYGVSSYGYDIRVADEFKIFTNVFGAIVDPKHFDPKSMVDFVGEVCVIPPNSFALARTVEYFRIPRKVLTVCIGKSTYARCFRGDTRVALVDGSAPTLEEMAKRAEEGKQFMGYSSDEKGHISVAHLESPRYIGRDSLVEVALDNNEKIHCTPEHRFLCRDGSWKAASELVPGQSLMPLYRSHQRRFQMVYQPVTGTLYPTSQLMAEDEMRTGIRANAPGNQTWPVERNTRVPEILGPLPISPSQPLNHKVLSVHFLPGDHDVFCLTVPGSANFALESGVFVHNCGIIVNVTPFEPEWEGFVTLEISNTTPLPAKIYANEGMAQVLFFEADEECETSYADKKGKYQKQQSIVLPKL
jgi:deoxycytidine triphosphate deaminase